MTPYTHDEKRYPHAPDVHERETCENGFARGWGAHFQTCESCLIDCHVHLRDKTADTAGRAVREFFDRLDAWRLRRVIVMDGRPETIDEYADLAKTDDRFCWLMWPRYDEPDLDFIDRGFKAGAAGLKLHNAPVIKAAGDPEVWLKGAWDPIFERLTAERKAILWHVTQRLTDSPYTGGGRNSYWQEGWDNGATYGNEEVLQAFLKVVARWPGIPVIGAHMLHLGYDRLAELFDAYPNLYIDTSVGGFVRWGDQMYPADREVARAFVTTYADRILFGTDCGIGVETTEEYVFEAFLGHVRYLRQLNLPDAALQAVAHGNAERLFGLPVVECSRKGNLRP